MSFYGIKSQSKKVIVEQIKTTKMHPEKRTRITLTFWHLVQKMRETRSTRNLVSPIGLLLASASSWTPLACSHSLSGGNNRKEI